MKPASPEDRELEALAADVSARYRDANDEQPPAHLDAAILEAAQRQASRPKKRNWHVPASIAAMLVIGVSLALMTSELEDPLPPLDPGTSSRDGGAARDADAVRDTNAARETNTERGAEPVAKSLRDTPEAQFGRDVGSRLSRERVTREQAEPEYRAAVPVSPEQGTGVAAPIAPPAPAAVQAQPPSEVRALSKREALADAESQAPSTAESVSDAAARKEGATPADWVKRIEALLREGRTGEAEQELARFRQRHPDYPLPQELREWSDELKR